ncbi:MAG: shikimate kinase [Pseudomonadota bacterium]
MSKTNIYAVAGTPVLHSKSPAIFNALFNAHAVDAIYTRIAARSADEAIYLFREIGLAGMNVTSPFKVEIASHLDFIDPEASSIGAVNTILNKDGALCGYNTDHIGVVKSLLKNGVNIAGAKCIVLGAGGAGRAAAYGLLKYGADVIMINRTFDKAKRAASALGCRAEKYETLKKFIEQADVLVSAVPTGTCSINAASLKKELVVLDANYLPPSFSEGTSGSKIFRIGGEEWLVQQAIPSYKYFTGLDPDEHLMSEAASLPTRPKGSNISLIGFMCSGKSSVGTCLSQILRLEHIDTDDYIQQASGKAIRNIIDSEGENSFRLLEKKAILQLNKRCSTVLSCGGGAVIDSRNRSVLRDNSLVVWLYSSPESIVTRLDGGSRPLLDGINPIHKAKSMLKDRLAFYADAADIIVASDGMSPKEIADRIHEEISSAFKNIWNY